MKLQTGVLLAVLIAVPAFAQPADMMGSESLPSLAPGEQESWAELPREALDTAALTSRGFLVLDMPDFEWKHAQTDHFVVHFEQAIFARKIARMAEFFYTYISQDLRGMEDRSDGRSHIFVFRNARRWQDMRRTVPGVPEWTFSSVERTVMLLQQAEDSQSSGTVFAHEMTHLVMNQFMDADVPLWLSEGLAEYYGEFGYAAFKGTKKSRRAQFRKLAHPYPLPDLFRATAYPSTDWQLVAFYETAKYMVAFLLLDQPPEKFVPFMNDLSNDQSITAAFRKHYGLEALPDIERAFHKFAY